MAKQAKQTIIDAIIKEIDLGNGRGKVLGKIGKDWEVSRTTFDRLWKTANEQHKELQDAAKIASSNEYIKKHVEYANGAVMSKAERQHILAKIARGELSIKKSISVGGIGVTEVDVYPDFSDIKNAVAEINKMEGDYSPTKTELTGKDGQPIEQSITVTLNI